MKKLLLEVRDNALNHSFVNTVVMVASRGSANYGLFTQGVSDLDFVCFYLPNRESLLLSQPKRNTSVKVNSDLEYELVDVRNLLPRLDKANISSLDFLWSKKVYVNPLAYNLNEVLKSNAFPLLKSRKRRLVLSHLGQANQRVLSKPIEEVGGKTLVQTFYFLRAVSFLVDVKKQERYFRLVSNANQWTKDFGTPDLMAVKFDATQEREKYKLYSSTKQLEEDLESRLPKMKEDVSLDLNPYYQSVKNELLKLLLDVANNNPKR